MENETNTVALGVLEDGDIVHILYSCINYSKWLLYPFSSGPDWKKQKKSVNRSYYPKLCTVTVGVTVYTGMHCYISGQKFQPPHLA